MPMLERIAGNRELKQDLKTALGSGRIAHSILLVGAPGREKPGTGERSERLWFRPPRAALDLIMQRIANHIAEN